jgi:purine catabolism regulator
MCGMNLRYEPASLSEMFDEFEQVGVAAVGFGVQPVFDRVPDDVLAQARDRGIPVLSVPARTPFRQIVARVFGAALSDDIRASHRLTAIQRYLMDALGQEAPQATLLERVATLVHGQAALLTQDGQLDRATDQVPAVRLWSLIRSRPVTTLTFELADRNWVATPVPTHDGRVHRWLVAGSSDGITPPHLLRSTAYAAVPILAAITQLQTAKIRQDRAFRAVVLDGLLARRDEQVLIAQLEQLGFEVGAELHALALVPSSEVASHADEILGALEEEVNHLGGAFLAAVQGDRVDAVVQLHSADGFDLLIEGLARLRLSSAGIGKPARTFDEIPRALRQAAFAAQWADADSGQIFRYFVGLPATDVVLGELELGIVREDAADLLDKLRGESVLLETVRAYFSHRMSITGTAQVLHLHPNSVRYRLARVEALMGRSLREPATIAALLLLLQLDGASRR